MKRNPFASFYALEVSVSPGGAREYLVFALNNLPDIRRELEQCLSDVYLTLWYGRKMQLHTVLDGAEQMPPLNLLPLITHFVDGYPPIGFDENNESTGLSREQIRNDKVLTDFLWQHNSKSVL